MYIKQHSYDGFTVVELLVVIIVIAILAAISLVAYGGIQGRAADSAIQNDLRNAHNLLEISIIKDNILPRDLASLETALGQLKVSRSSYGNHLIDSGMAYNLLYCFTVNGYTPEEYALIARGKSGKVYALQHGSTRELPSSSWSGGWGTICPATLEVSVSNSGTGIWLYENSIWKSWLQ